MIAKIIKHKQRKIPNRYRAPTNGIYAIVINGKRELRYFQSGQPFVDKVRLA